MIIIKEAVALVRYLGHQKANKKRIGFVPTMGALHAGHMALVEQAEKACDEVVCSIFVNPTQFNNSGDFQKYPSTLEQDIYNLETSGVGVLFLPDVDEMYPSGTTGLESYDLGYLENILEGKYRPGHFQGVCQVMSRLMKFVQPDALFMGQKDYQQCMVIKHLLGLIHLSTTFITCPTVREPDGLAMSSRNMRLDEESRKKAVTIYRSLLSVKEHLQPGAVNNLKLEAINKLEQAGFKVDYVEIANAETLKLVEQWDGKETLVALAAAFLGDVRLIDNIIVKQ